MLEADKNKKHDGTSSSSCSSSSSASSTASIVVVATASASTSSQKGQPSTEEKATTTYPEFNYESLVKALLTDKDFIESSDKLLFASRDIEPGGQAKDFYVLSFNDSMKMRNKSPDARWKFHISLNDEIEGNIARGWNVFKNVMIQYKIGMTKVVIPSIKISKTTGQTGKQITIYTWYNKNITLKQWGLILKEATTAFVRADIQPGFQCIGSFVKEEIPIKWSSYFTCRFEGGEAGKCPYGTIDLSTIKQPSPQQPVTSTSTAIQQQFAKA